MDLKGIYFVRRRLLNFKRLVLNNRYRDFVAGEIEKKREDSNNNKMWMENAVNCNYDVEDDKVRKILKEVRWVLDGWK